MNWEDISEDRRKRELEIYESKAELAELGFDEDEITRQIEGRLSEIREYTGETHNEVAIKINHAFGIGSELWEDMSPVTEKELALFHSVTDRKIYSVSGICDYLAVIREKMLLRIPRGSSLLDFGGSHGHFTLRAVEEGIFVTYADVGDTIRDYVRWRLNRSYLEADIAPIENNRCVFNKRKYDYITLLDVASHLPNLKGYIDEFYSVLNDGGLLIFGDDLFDFNVPWHLEENKVYRDIEKKKELFKDFELVEQLWANCVILRKG